MSYATCDLPILAIPMLIYCYTMIGEGIYNSQVYFLPCLLQAFKYLLIQSGFLSSVGMACVSYCLLHTTFPTPLFHTQMHPVFEVLYLTQFLMDSLKSWTAHSPICTLDV